MAGRRTTYVPLEGVLDVAVIDRSYQAQQAPAYPAAYPVVYQPVPLGHAQSGGLSGGMYPPPSHAPYPPQNGQQQPPMQVYTNPALQMRMNGPVPMSQTFDEAGRPAVVNAGFLE